MSRIIISDAGCLIALRRLNKLELLRDIFGTVMTTSEIRNEVSENLPAWIETRECTKTSKKKDLEKIVDAGQASVIALALETSNAVLIIDEKKGRKLARESGIEIIGTLKVLLIAQERGLIPQITPLLKELEK
jgi:predicted nucleic acid-binding protein